MKKLNYSWSFVLILALLFTSCSKDETSGIVGDTDKVALSFGAVLNDLRSNRAASKAHLADFPVCSDANADYVEIVLTQGGSSVVGTMLNPFKIDLVAGQLFTEDVPELELEAGMYSLDYFAVYDVNDNLIWIAPKTGGSLANFVDEPLSLPIDLRNGVKKYVDVTVLCFEDRMVNEYGYLFFEINQEKALEFCFFANYCDDTGRHFPASYSVNIWMGTDNTGAVLYSNVSNTVGQYSNGDYFASPLCFALPDNDALNTAYLYYEVTLSDWAAVYGDVPQTVISGTLTKQDILDNHVGGNEVDYEHLRFNCGDNPGGGDCPITDADLDGDCIPNEQDCDQTPGAPGCPGGGDDCASNGGDLDEDGICDNDDDCVNGVGPGCNQDGCDETAFMQGDIRFDEIQNGPNRWGWIENFNIATENGKSYDIYAGASTKYKLNDDTRIGAVTISFNDATNLVTLTFDFENSSNGFSELHVNVSETIPARQTLQAPGQYNRNGLGGAIVDGESVSFTYNNPDGDFYIVVHGADACKDGDDN